MEENTQTNQEEQAPVDLDKLKKERLKAELEAKELSYKGKNIPYKKEFKSVPDKVKGGDKIVVANPITPENPYLHTTKSTRAMRRGNEKVEFSEFQDSIVTHHYRKNQGGKWVQA